MRSSKLLDMKDEQKRTQGLVKTLRSWAGNIGFNGLDKLALSYAEEKDIPPDRIINGLLHLYQNLHEKGYHIKGNPKNKRRIELMPDQFNTAGGYQIPLFDEILKNESFSIREWSLAPVLEAGVIEFPVFLREGIKIGKVFDLESLYADQFGYSNTNNKFGSILYGRIVPEKRQA